ncbi:MAG: polyhydroxyalkanoate granule-associated phasin [Burkholderiales bacterium]
MKAVMATRRTRSSNSLAVKSAELAFAVPKVVAHRVTRMALSGPTMSARDKKEFTRMVEEKNAAFAESWRAMCVQAALANQALAASFFRSFLAAALGKRPSAAPSAVQVQKAALGVLGKGLDPVHRKATANAKRLARTKLR